MTLDTFFKKFGQFADAPNAVAKMRELVLEWAATGKLCHSASAKWKDGTLEEVIELISGQHLMADEHNVDGRGIPYLTGPSDFGEKSPIPTRWTEHPKVTAQPGDILITVKGSGVGKTNVLRDVPTAISRQLMAVRVVGANPEFVHFVLKRAAKYFQDAKTGIAIPGIGRREVLDLNLVLPPLAEQKRIVAKVDELMALCDRLEAQQQQRDEQASALARASLARFAQAPTPANLNLLFHKSYSISPADLRKAILAMAVQGTLVSQDPSDESAIVSLRRIESLKVRLQKSGEIGKDKPVDPLISADLPFDIPSSWEWVKLADLTELITKGSSPKWQGVAYVSEAGGVLFITSENVGNYTLRKLDDLKYVEKRFNKIEPRSILKHGDILMNLVGASIGRTGLYSLHDPANINQAVALIRLVRDAEGICPAFLLHFLNSPSAIDTMLSSRVVTAQPNISLTDARNFAIPFPPLAEQRRIVAKVDQLMALVDQLETQLAASRATAKNLLEALVADLTTR
jgi:type I restriction enzyme S subunit